jgi:K+-sensing histidine kinase KdpD
LTGEAASEATMYRVLASLGLEHSAFVHEVNSLALAAQAITGAMEKLAAQTLSPNIRRRFKQIAADASALRERLRRNAVYLTDVAGIEGRRRRSRQYLHERFETAKNFFVDALAKRKIQIENRIPSDLRTPPMFPAEMIAVLSNLLSNAIKFSGTRGRICAKAREDEDNIVFRLENTGAAVDLKAAEKWFEPFRSSTVDVDETLGQGMGLGLTITRSLIDEYGGDIRFVKPENSYSTAIEVWLPRKCIPNASDTRYRR